MKIDLYSKPNCPQCVQAKAFLEARGVQFDVFMLDIGQEKQEGVTYVTREHVLEEFPGARMMPLIRVFSHGEAANVSFNELKQMLA